MRFTPPLLKANLIKRYKRFLVDIYTLDRSKITIHCPNTGSMKNCLYEGQTIWYSKSSNENRKYPFTLEITETIDSSGNTHLIGVNTARANALIKEAIEAGVITELQGYETLKTEAKYGQENSRIDILLQDKNRTNCFVEVKNVTMAIDFMNGAFPDAVSTRGLKHLRELIYMVEQGMRAVLLFCVQHTGIQIVKPADDIDPEYGNVLRQASKKGVEILAYGACLSPDLIEINKKLAVDLE